MINNVLYAKLLPHLKRSFNLAYLENGTNDQIVAHLERELEISRLENDGELSIPPMATTTTTKTKQQQQIICQYCKKPGLVLKKSGAHS